MSTVRLFESHWAYLPSSTRIQISTSLLTFLFHRAQGLENLNLYTPAAVADLGGLNIATHAEMEQLSDHLRTRVLHKPELHNFAITAYCRLWPSSEIWLQFRADQWALRVSAQNSVRYFRSETGDAEAAHSARRAAGDVIDLASELLSHNQSLKELMGRFRQRLTFFVGEPELLYRPPLFERFYLHQKLDESAEMFWELQQRLKTCFPRDQVIAMLESSPVDFTPLHDGRIRIRFCRAFDEIEIDGDSILDEVRELAEQILASKGLLDERWLRNNSNA